MSTTRTVVQSYIIISGQSLPSTEPYETLRDRVEAARESMGFTATEETFNANPMGVALVHTRAVVNVEGDAVEVDACFNPFYVTMMYAAIGEEIA
jgi:hypothetical protein